MEPIHEELCLAVEELLAGRVAERNALSDEWTDAAGAVAPWWLPSVRHAPVAKGGGGPRHAVG